LQPNLLALVGVLETMRAAEALGDGGKAITADKCRAENDMQLIRIAR